MSGIKKEERNWQSNLCLVDEKRGRNATPRGKQPKKPKNSQRRMREKSITFESPTTIMSSIFQTYYTSALLYQKSAAFYEFDYSISGPHIRKSTFDY